MWRIHRRIPAMPCAICRYIAARISPRAMVVAGYASVANTVLYQIQDLLFLPNSARMNFPSTLGGNWRWRLVDGQLTVELADWLRGLTEIYGR